MGLDIDLVLAAADNTQEASDATEYAVAIADRYDADLHLLHVTDQRIARGLESGDLEAEAVAKRMQWITARARQAVPEGSETTIRESSAPGFSQDRLGRTPGGVILDCAENLGADFLVVPRVTPHGSTDEVLGKAATYVLEYAEQPVLSV
jgi:nucleotide-binding universal stress UspA family protein